MKMGQLTNKQRTFIVEAFCQLGSLARTRDAFKEIFPEKEGLAITMIR